jgi:hypothetical protein
MDVGSWFLVWLFIALAASAAGCGLWHDMTHRPRRERLLTRTTYDVLRAQTMSSYYASNHGTEW